MATICSNKVIRVAIAAPDRLESLDPAPVPGRLAIASLVFVLLLLAFASPGHTASPSQAQPSLSTQAPHVEAA